VQSTFAVVLLMPISIAAPLHHGDTLTVMVLVSPNWPLRDEMLA